MIKVVLDTNVYVSAFLFGGPPAHVAMLSEEGAFRICVSTPIVRELKGVLTAKFGWDRKELANTLDSLLANAEPVSPRKKMDVSQDPDDNRILECAIAAGAAAIVTGDHGLLRLRSVEGVRILTPRQFLESKMWEE